MGRYGDDAIPGQLDECPLVVQKYMDEVYTAGMDGRLCAGDGRTAEAPKANYGLGGTLRNTTYMLSVTLNAPAEAFDNPNEIFLAVSDHRDADFVACFFEVSCGTRHQCSVQFPFCERVRLMAVYDVYLAHMPCLSGVGP